MIPDLTILFTVNEREKRLDYRKVPYNAWGELKNRQGFTPKTLLTALFDLDLDAGEALLWLERRQREKTVPWHEILDLMSQNPTIEVTQFIGDGRDIATGEQVNLGDPAVEADPTNG